MKRIFFIAALFCALSVSAQRIPEALEYTEIYDFLEELTTDGVIRSNAAIKPYTRDAIAKMLAEAQSRDSLLDKRQKADLQFYMQDYALELDTLPTYYTYGHRHVTQWKTKVSNLNLADPSLHILTKDKIFKMRIRPILGMDLLYNKHGLSQHRWFGAEIQMDIAHHVSIWGSLRDNTWRGLNGDASKLTKPGFLNDIPGVQYKENSYTGDGGDFSDSRGGISIYAWWGSIGIQRERITWGDAQHCSNILSGHNPAVPMFTIQLTPCKWFQFDYFHAWLPSNVIDSTYYYDEEYRRDATTGEIEMKRHYRPANKFMAANMFTFMPCKYIQFGFGNSIVYAERNVQAAYFIPIAFFKSLDHLLTKGVNSENQNSQLFGTLTLRPTDHLRLYGSVFVDEFKLGRLKKSNKEHNLVSYVVGFNWSGWPVKGLALRGEFMRAYIACYTHSIKVLDYTSNGYNMGHYMGDNAQSIFVQLSYRPTRSLRLTLDYTQDTKYTAYPYIRREIGWAIAQKPFNKVIWKNDIIRFRAVYEVFNNCYAHVECQFNNARAPKAEDLKKYSPTFYSGKNLTLGCGVSFGF